MAINSSQELLILNFNMVHIGPQNTNDFLSGKFSTIASSKIQIRPAVKACINVGLMPKIWSLSSCQPENLNAIDTPRACVIGKLTASNQDSFNQMTIANLAAVARLNRKKIPITLIYSDHSLAHTGKFTPIKELYQDLVNLANIIITPSQKLKELLKAEGIKKPIKIIEDPGQYGNRFIAPWAPMKASKLFGLDQIQT